MRRLLVPSIALVASLLACDGMIEDASTAADAASTTPQPEQDAGDAGSCSLSGDRCIGASGCCPPRVGFRVDFIRNCKSATPTALSCDAPPPSGTFKCGRASDEESCLSRTSDAGPDGGVEVYWTNNNFGVPAGFSRCDEYVGYPSCP